MRSANHESHTESTSRKPLFGSVWMALFALLREQATQLRPAPISRDESLSRQP
jgi:hypothetical protein